MPAWNLAARSVEIPRNIALLDTNVLVAMFDVRDPRYQDTNAAIDLGAFRWSVSYTAIIEAWNFLAGKLKRAEAAHSMMEWVLTPGNVILIEDEANNVELAHRYAVRYKIDIVDAAIADMATRLTKSCGIYPPVHVATYDTRDFLRLFGQDELAFHVYDMRDLSSTTGA